MRGGASNVRGGRGAAGEAAREAPPSASRLVRGYYLATPLFFGFDALLGLELRAAFLEPASARYAWYAACFLLGLAAWRWPVSGPWVGLIESATNLFFLCLAVWLPLVTFDPLDPAAGEAVGLAGPSLLAFVLVGGAGVVSFHSAKRQISARITGASARTGGA